MMEKQGPYQKPDHPYLEKNFVCDRSTDTSFGSWFLTGNGVYLVSPALLNHCKMDVWQLLAVHITDMDYLSLLTSLLLYSSIA